MQRLTETTEAKLQLSDIGQLTPGAGKHNCYHHWVIDLAVGPLSKGECRLCGAERLFRNHLRWAEIAPARAMVGQRQADSNPFISEGGGTGRRAFDSGGTEPMG
jgi:hypothetical protein